MLVALPNCPAFLLLLLAVNECGAVFIPVSPGLAADERGRVDAIARPDVVIADRGTVELLPGAFLSPHRVGRRTAMRMSAVSRPSSLRAARPERPRA